MFERFTDEARRVFILAQEEARLLNHNHLGTEHVLLGLLHTDEVAGRVLESAGVSLEVARQHVEEMTGQDGESPSGSPAFTPRAKKVVELSAIEAEQLGHGDDVGTGTSC